MHEDSAYKCVCLFSAWEHECHKGILTEDNVLECNKEFPVQIQQTVEGEHKATKVIEIQPAVSILMSIKVNFEFVQGSD